MDSLERLNMLCEEANGLDEEYLDEGWFGDRVDDAKRFLSKHGKKIAVGIGAAATLAAAILLAKKLGKIKKAKVFQKAEKEAEKEAYTRRYSGRQSPEEKYSRRGSGRTGYKKMHQYEKTF